MYIRRPHTTLEMGTPYELVYHEQPSLAHLKVFGCTAFVHLDQHQRARKLDHNS